MGASVIVGLIGQSALSTQVSTFDGSQLSLWWAMPFIGMLLSMAIVPVLASDFWHRHFGKITLAWALAFLLPCASVFGIPMAVGTAMHVCLAEYFPFVILMVALFVVAGGICVNGNLHGTPALNTGLLALGALLASVMGTTGASMLMIRPLIRANDNRRHARHTVVFFIFLVANVGGALSPLGDPPLFLGFLKGIDFFWTVKNIFFQTLFLCVALLSIFYFLDCYYYRHCEEEFLPALDPTPDSDISVDGKINFIFLLAIVGLVLMSGLWRSSGSLNLLGTSIGWGSLTRDSLLIVVILISLWITPTTARANNEFSWGPMREVAKLFAGLFITLIPVVAILRAGEQGAFAGVIQIITDTHGQPIDRMYFWTVGLLSSVLDNAPTYLVFFNAAGGDPMTLMGRLGSTLAAISCGSVFMGALSYIGNAPNMMVRAIAQERGIRMPSFFGYMGWSILVLIPLFGLMSVIFF